MRDVGVESVLVTEQSGEGVGERGDPGDDGEGGVHLESEPMEFERKCINNTKSFFSSKINRSIMLCEREKRTEENLIDVIENELAEEGCLMFYDPVGSSCGVIYVNARGEKKSVDIMKVGCKQEQPRKVTIFTLNHGAITAVLLDLRFIRCGYENKYRGNTYGLFPAA